MIRVTGFFIALLLFVASPSCSSDNPRDGGEKSAPNFVLKTADGETVELKQLAGKVVVINFWATWCGPCRAEIPVMLEVYDKYKEKGLEIVGISLDRDGWRVVTPFVERMEITYPVVLGDRSVVQQYGGIYGIPTTFVVDREGSIVERHTGYFFKEDFERILAKLL